jgi:hypothetical protein
MRVMVIVKADKNSEAGVLPSKKLLAEMGKFNEELVKAGVMLAGEGLQASSKGVRVKFSGGKRTVIDGPFTETKELVAGFWLWQMNGSSAPRSTMRRLRSVRCSRRRTSLPRYFRPRRPRASKPCAMSCRGRPGSRSRGGLGLATSV